MTSEEYIKQQISAGYKVHFNEGIWWQRVRPLCYKPAAIFDKIEPGESGPHFKQLCLKYSHMVSNKSLANAFWSVMFLKQEKLKNFSMKSLSSSHRARVRKGLNQLEIKKINQIEPVIDDIKNICISTAIRTNHGKPPEYYVNNYQNWKSWIIKEFNIPKREWWGAYNQKSLVAYMYSVHINDIMYNFTAKSHTDFLDKCPNDALIFTFLEYCSTLDGCKHIIFGDWGNNLPTLNRFKEKYGFEKVDLPMYEYYNPLVKLAIKTNRFISRVRKSCE
jgi:hypothetical protein